MGYNSACAKDFWEFFAPVGGLRGWANECCQSHFSPTDPRCHGNEIWDKMGYNSACVKDFCEIFAPIGDGPSNAANRNFPRPTPVAMTT